MNKFNIKEMELDIRCNVDGTFSSNSADAALKNYYHTTALVIAVDFFEALKRTMLSMNSESIKNLKIKCTWEKE